MNKQTLFLALFALFVVISGLFGSTSSYHVANEWKNRTIYQLLTDRFALDSSSSNGCSDLGNYCGGSYKGIMGHLDYIAGMGFDAIWISPIVTNTNGGYHGYWASDFTGVNSHFGTEQDLHDFIAECHKRDIWVMVDIVLNHVGPVGTDFSRITPFNTGSDYHSDCQVNEYNCFTDEVLNCRLAGLPDLNQDQQKVKDGLFAFGDDLMNKWDFDGIRADTVMYIKQSFWQDFSNHVKMYIVGEVFSTLDCQVAYQQQGVDGLLNYPLYFTLRDVFQGGKSFHGLSSLIQNINKQYKNPSLLGTFIDNHDNPRFLNQHTNLGAQYSSVITYVLMSEGIPIIYYGTEQSFSGGGDPGCREVLWPTKFNTNTDLYKLIKQVVAFRKNKQIFNHPQVERYVLDQIYVFTRGDALVALSNDASGTHSVNVTYQPYSDGTTLCNIFATDGSDCIKVANGQVKITVGKGLPKIYYPSS